MGDDAAPRGGHVLFVIVHGSRLEDGGLGGDDDGRGDRGEDGCDPAGEGGKSLGGAVDFGPRHPKVGPERVEDKEAEGGSRGWGERTAFRMAAREATKALGVLGR